LRSEQPQRGKVFKESTFMHSPTDYKVAVIGAGPAGLMAAERLARAGVKVTIFDRMASPGRKLLMAGRGGLNLTHSEPLDSFMARYGASAPNLAPALAAFAPTAMIAFAQGLGQETFVGTSGRVFPKVMKASPLLRAWLVRLAELGVTLHLNRRWTGWNEGGALTFESADAGAVSAEKFDATILALGGASWPRLGSDGQWQTILRDTGVDVANFEASNVGFIIPWSEHVRARSLGEPLKRVSISCGAHRVRGEAVITATGLEGGAIYALGASVREALHHGPVTIHVDLRPDISASDLTTRLNAARGKDSLSNYIRKRAGLSAAAITILREAHGPHLPAHAADLAASIKSVPLRVTALGALDRAISTAGGVTWDGLDPQLMLKAKPGVFVAGEMIDWDAPTGGYLLQATISTACIAADGALQWLKLTSPARDMTQ
jgi:uncharacterized flavoprotein (TIGR03862 family)